MNAQYLTDYPLDGYLHSRRSREVALRRDRFNLRPLLESLGWVLAGATVGSMASIVADLLIAELIADISPTEFPDSRG